MAIIIPSKNIFQIQNEKINDNAINKVVSSVNIITITEDNEVKTEQKEFVFGIEELDNEFTNQANELINDKVTYNDEPLYAHIANQEISEYKNGKETATIVCGIANYYDENGNKVIAIDEPYKSMIFSMYQKIIPYVYDNNRQDRPMSRYKDGTPKTFQIVGVEPYYDGAVWQKLTLQEVEN